MSKRRGTNKENLEETRRNFIEIATQEFTEFGFAQASTSRIVEHSGMARGSLYYHFGDKNGLFHAVYEHVMDESMKHISEKMDVENTAWGAFIVGSHAFLDLCMEKHFRKIILIESQAAMTYQDRLEIQKRTLLGKLSTLLPELFQKGYFKGHTPNTISTFIFGILGEIGRAMDFSEDIEVDRAEYGSAFDTTMKAIAKQA